MEGEFFTLAMWKVQPGREGEFQAAWSNLSQAFGRLAHPRNGAHSS